MSYKQHRAKNREIFGRSNFSEKLTRALISYLDKEDEWTNSNSLGVKLLHLLWDIANQEGEDIKSKSVASTYIFSNLTVTEEVEEVNCITKQREKVRRASSFTKKDSARIRTLLQILQLDGVSFHDSVVKAVCKNLEVLHNKLFQMTSCFRFNFYDKNDTRDETVALIEFLNEIYLVMSYQMESKSWSKSALVLENPHKVVKHTQPFSTNRPATMVIDFFLNAATSKMLKPGPLFSEPMDQALACMFAQKMPKKDREEVLNQILVAFSDYESQKTFYPLAKVVLGVIGNDDIPLWDKESLLVPNLKNYKGVFSEDISQELKDAYWKALLEGKLGGTTKELIDGLRDFYLLNSTSEAMKKDIVDTLWRIGKYFLHGFISGINYHHLNTGEVNKYARDAYESLTS